MAERESYSGWSACYEIGKGGSKSSSGGWGQEILRPGAKKVESVVQKQPLRVEPETVVKTLEMVGVNIISVREVRVGW